MRVMIVDDEMPARKRLRRLLEQQPDLEVVAEAAQGEQALQLAREHKPSLVLLDIQMPGMGGVDVARILSSWDPAPAVIFCTAYDQHALAAFEVAALDYLLKPIERSKLEKAILRASRLTPLQIEDVQTASTPHLVVSAGHSKVKLALTDVFYLKAEQKYVVAVHRGGEALLRESLQQLEKEWPQYFVRAHRNTLIARHCLLGVVREGGLHRARLVGLDDEPLISRRHLQDVKMALTESD